MGSDTITYVAKVGDYLVKIAEEHGTTWQAIWNHPENAGHRAKRGVPKTLYPGDVLQIPVAPSLPVPPQPTQPPQPPAIEPPALPPVPEIDPPWPYPPQSVPPNPVPTWACPEGLCVCHPSDENEERIEHTIVFFDPQGKRMPLARCRVYEQGRLITLEPTKADALGELVVLIRASTTTLKVEWAPPLLPQHAFLPYLKRYHVQLDEDANRATERRLSNLGFSEARSLEGNIASYQEAYGRLPTGQLDEVQNEIASHHDQGTLPMFVGHRAQGEPGSAEHSDPAVKSFFGNPSPATRSLRLDDGVTQYAAPGQAGGGPSAGPTQQGAVVPNAGNLLLLVGLEGGTGPLNLGDLTVSLRPKIVPGMNAPQLKTLVKPSLPGAHWIDANHPNMYAVFGFLDLPKGTYSAVAALDKASTVGGLHGVALGSAEIEIKTGLLTLGGVLVQKNRPILTVKDPLLDLDHPRMQRRRKVLATIHNQFPQSAQLTSGIEPPYQQGSYRTMFVAGGGNTCTPVNTLIMHLASGHGHEYGTNQVTHPGFTTFKPDLLPSVGDCYYLDNGAGHFEHAGIVVQSAPAGGMWLCADGGQPDRTSPFQDGPEGFRRYYGPPPSFEAAYVVPRIVTVTAGGAAKEANLFIFPTDTHRGHFVNGFTDITHPAARFSKAPYDKHGTEADYYAMKQLLEAIPPRVEQDRVAAAKIKAAAKKKP